MPMQVCPALDIAPQAAASPAGPPSPPHSASTGVSVSAAAASTFLAVAADPVKASLLTPDFASSAPVGPSPVTSWRTGSVSPNPSDSTSVNDCTSHCPTPVVSSLGLNTTAFPAARADAIDPMGVSTG